MENDGRLPDELSRLIEAELSPQEQVVWSAQPLPGRYMRKSVAQVIFGIPWTAFSVSWVVIAWIMTHSVPEKEVQGMPFAGFSLLFPLLGLLNVLIGLGMLSSPYWMWRKAQKTVYALTDERALILTPTWRGGVSVRSITPEELSPRRRLRNPDGSGSLFFSRLTVTQGGGGGPRSVVTVGFEHIADVLEVEALIEKTYRVSASGGVPPPLPGLTKPLVTAPLADFGSLPRFTYRREGQCFVLTPARHTAPHVLEAVILISLVLVTFGMLAVAGAFAIYSSWQAWHGINGPGVTINGSLPSQAGTPAIVGAAVMGAGLFLFGFIPTASIVWATGKDLCFGTRPCVLDRGRGEFRVGPRVVCGLGDIARLHLRWACPAYLPGGRYYGSVVLRNGRQVPLGPRVRESTSRVLQEAELGDGSAGAQIEAVMEAAAAFLGVEYVLTGGPDARLRGSELTCTPKTVPPAR